MLWFVSYKVVSCAHIKAQYESQPRCSCEYSLYASLSPQNITALAFLQRYEKKMTYANKK